MAKPEAAALAMNRLSTPDSPQIELRSGADATSRAKTLPTPYPHWNRRADEPTWAFAYQLAIAYGRAGQLADADITLADEALMTGDKQQAIKMAKRSLSHGSVDAETQTVPMIFCTDMERCKSDTWQSC